MQQPKTTNDKVELSTSRVKPASVKKKVTKKGKQQPGKKAVARSLREKHEIFVKAFASNGFNATRAYVTAFGCAESTARRNASRLLTKADIQEAVRQSIDGVLEELEISPQRVLEEIAKMAFCNMDDFVKINDDGSAYVDFSAVKGKRRKMAKRRWLVRIIGMRDMQGAA